jgi:hypothetical protein
MLNFFFLNYTCSELFSVYIKFYIGLDRGEPGIDEKAKVEQLW